jgi:16S rRNA (guanine527-N7)-methyltransferase
MTPDQVDRLTGTAAGGLTEPLQEVLVSGAAEMGIDLGEQAVGRFDRFLSELLVWNNTRNLTAIRDPAEIVTKHFLDSLTCVAGYDFQTGRPILDVGTGAGFPGIPLKIAFPALRLSVLDSSIKKVEFLNHLAPLLGFRDIDVLHGRAELYGHVGSARSHFHLVVTRAVAPLPVLAELCLPFVVLGGYFLAQKNRDLGTELEDGQRAFGLLGGSEAEVIPVRVPHTELERSLIRVRKEAPTASAYPRRPGQPAARPLHLAPVTTKRRRRKFD